jgi:hypothetical protein
VEDVPLKRHSSHSQEKCQGKVQFAVGSHGCQMPHFHSRNTIFGIFRRPWNETIWYRHFMAIMLGKFGIFCGHTFHYNKMYQEKTGNPG